MVTYQERQDVSGVQDLLKSFQARSPLGDFFRANGEKSNLIGRRQTLTTSPANHNHDSAKMFLL